MATSLVFSQTSNVKISVVWPNWASENRIEVYNPAGNILIASIGYVGSGNNSYSTTLDLGCIPNGNGYILRLYDSRGDGWDGAANITITSGGNIVINTTGKNIKSNGVNTSFNVYGGCIETCNTVVNSFPYIEGFESGIGLWQQSQADTLDWDRTQNGTTSNNTGPASAHGGNSYLYTEATDNFNKTAYLNSPCFNLTGLSDPEFSFWYHMYGADMGNLSVYVSIDNGNTYNSTPLWTLSGQVQTSHTEAWKQVKLNLSAYIGKTIRLRFQGALGNGYRSDMAIDGIALTENPLAVAPGGVTSHLNLWLKGTDGLGYSDGDRVSVWEDHGRAQNAVAPTSAVRPYYRDNATKNINFNPVVDFNNSYKSIVIDNDYSYDNPNTQFLQGGSGFYSQDVFVVVLPNVPVNSSFGSMDLFCGDQNPAQNETDGTGIGFGNYSSRFNDEVLSYAIGTSNDYGVAQTSRTVSYANVGIINSRNNTTGNGQELYYNGLNKRTIESNPGTFKNVSNSRYWIGRSEGWEASTDARIAEIITYSTRKSDANLTQDRNRIMSYLAIKYGITLGANGTSQNYVNSSGEIVWNQAANAGFNHDVTGIARDDKSGLNQKQSRSVNNASDGLGRTQGILTMGLSDIYATNNLNKLNNPTNLTDKQFLVWGNNGVDLNTAATTITVNISAGISTALTTDVSFTAMARVWKVVENGGNIPSVKLSIPQNAIRNITPPGRYYMFISNTSTFGDTADYRLMTSDGKGNLVTDYDFDNTKYITFGYAPQTVVERSVYFTGFDAKNGRGDYIDMANTLNLNPADFTVSAWIKRDATTLNACILSKRNTTFTQGYEVRINALGKVEMTWKNSGTQSIISNTIIPPNKWHQVAISYSSGTARLYIDGVLDKTTNLTAPVINTESFYLGTAGINTSTDYFRGHIDEVRVWDVALSVDQLRFIMNQEIVANGLQVGGKKLPTTLVKNDVASIPWSKLAGYYPMSIFTFTNTEDASGNGNQGAIRHLKTVDRQTAPLPYTSMANGEWSTATTWRNNDVQYLPNALSIVNGTPITWNIVETAHDIKIPTDGLLGRSRIVLGLSVEANTLTVDGSNLAGGSGNALVVTHYLKLNGTIDLNGESQLIQTLGSELDVSSTGTLERDQQGSADTFTYNYWASPVGISNANSNNNTYTLAAVLKDGTNPNTPLPISFIGGYNGAAGSPIKLANYWIWKYANQPENNYSKWQHVKSTGTLKAGEGFTMKGPGTGAVIENQNYVFAGKPNNGAIELDLTVGNDYLVGNPYASALDADQFIADNTMVITGTLYFWEHWGGGSHTLKQYEGGYAMYNYSGGIVAATMNPDLGNANPAVLNGSKMPARYIPVSQGFFVHAQNGGKIKFNNGQRAYVKETLASSVFMRHDNTTQGMTPLFRDDKESAIDNRLKIRLRLKSVNNISRQLLLTVDERATAAYDWGFDGLLNDSQRDDMYWIIDTKNYAIQGTNTITEETKIQLGLHTSITGKNVIGLESLENAPNTLNIYLHDKALDLFHDLRQSPYTVDLLKGNYTDRFEMVFSNKTTLATPDKTLEDVVVYYANASQSIVLSNPSLKNIRSLELFNLLGQSVKSFTNLENTEHSEYKVKDLSVGAYIIKLTTDDGSLSKKVLIK